MLRTYLCHMRMRIMRSTTKTRFRIFPFRLHNLLPFARCQTLRPYIADRSIDKTIRIANCEFIWQTFTEFTERIYECVRFPMRKIMRSLSANRQPIVAAPTRRNKLWLALGDDVIFGVSNFLVFPCDTRRFRFIDAPTIELNSWTDLLSLSQCHMPHSSLLLVRRTNVGPPVKMAPNVNAITRFIDQKAFA